MPRVVTVEGHVKDLIKAKIVLHALHPKEDTREYLGIHMFERYHRFSSDGSFPSPSSVLSVPA